MDKIGALLEKMEHALLVPHLSLAQKDVVNVLDQRDDPQFAEAWMSAFHKIAAQKGGGPDAEPRVGRLRELAYLQAFERWKSSDLAAYISDDFGLIGDALATNVEDNWLNGLLHAYLRLEFPHSATI